MQITTRTAELLTREDLSPSLALFRFRTGGPRPEFLAGQWMSLGLKIGGKQVWRPYSISSPPEELDHLEFYIRRVWKPVPGVLTTALWNMSPGDEIQWKPPRGNFTIQDHLPDGTPDERRLLFVGGGTGLAPFVSIVRHLRAIRSQRPIILCHGASYVDELGYSKLFTRLERERSDGWSFRYVPTVSRPAHERNVGWTGLTGRVETLLAPETTDGTLSILERQLEIEFTPGKTMVYVCGYAETIKRVLETIEPRHFRPWRASHPGDAFDVKIDSFG